MSTELDIPKLRSAMQAQGITQSELVKRSEISRAQLSRLLSRDRSVVRMQTISRLASGLGMDPAELTVDGCHQQYLDWVADETGFVDFRGIGTLQHPKQPIEDVFVEPDVVDWRVADHDGEDDCAVSGRPWGESPLQPSPACNTIAKQDRVVVVGHPGNGKTTLLRWLAFRAASGKLPDARSVIYVRLSELSRALEIDPNADPVKLAANVAEKRGCREIERLLNEELRANKCLVLLDGLDEVGDETRRDQLVETIRLFVERYPRNRFVLTSRVVGFEPSQWTGLGFSVVRMLGYRDEQLNEFTDKWSKILPKVFGGDVDSVRSSLANAIFANKRVRQLASNPLVLTILCLLNQTLGGALPRRRVDLYSKVVEVFLNTWEQTKRSADTFDETSDIDLDAREFGWLLSDMALAMQKNDRTLAARWWITDRVKDCLQNKLGFEIDQAKDVGERLLRYVTERTGLIEERGLDQFAFSHRTLQEYFAAMGVIDEADASATRDVSDQLSGYFFHPQWSEVVRLVAAKVTPPVAESMITTILDDPDPVGRNLLLRGPMLALRCLSDGATVPNRRLISGIFDSLTELGRSKWLGITFEALGVLDTFRGTRLEKEATQTVDAILQTAQRELDFDEYTSLYQHAHWEEVFEQIELQLGSDSEKSAAKEVTAQVDSQSVPIVYFNGTLRDESPGDWFKSLCSLVQDDAQSIHFRKLLVRELGRQIETHPSPRRALRKLIESNMPTELRAKATEALTGTSDSRLLVRVLGRDDEEIRVRQAAASSLRNVARSDAAIKERLMQILDSDGPESLRIGAARGLTRVALHDPEATTTLLKLATCDGMPERLRSACAWTLSAQIGRNRNIRSAFEKWLDSPEDSQLRRVAAQTMAHWMTDEPSAWDHELIEKIENILMNLDDPCPHALDSLESIATTREVQRGLRLENVLRDLLKRVPRPIELAFVFGSTARKRQTQDSDIDLMVIGDVSLKELSTSLRQAEKTLGRRINPALYSRGDVQRKYQSGDPFLTDVYRREKIPVSPAGFSRKDLDNELRAMVTERVAETV